jgi:hypothetical protein
MSEARQIQKPKTTGNKKKQPAESDSESLSADQKNKLKALDEYIEGVLEEAGEDFLDQFKQIEGQ